MLFILHLDRKSAIILQHQPTVWQQSFNRQGNKHGKKNLRKYNQMNSNVNSDFAHILLQYQHISFWVVVNLLSLHGANAKCSLSLVCHTN